MDSLKNAKEAQKPQSEFSRKKLLIEAAVRPLGNLNGHFAGNFPAFCPLNCPAAAAPMGILNAHWSKKIVDKPSPYVSTLVQKLADAEIRKNL
jgi:hypothetical protein